MLEASNGISADTLQKMMQERRTIEKIWRAEAEDILAIPTDSVSDKFRLM
jgi:hypothetical protein